MEIQTVYRIRRGTLYRQRSRGYRIFLAISGLQYGIAIEIIHQPNNDLGDFMYPKQTIKVISKYAI